VNSYARQKNLFKTKSTPKLSSRAGERLARLLRRFWKKFLQTTLKIRRHSNRI